MGYRNTKGSSYQGYSIHKPRIAQQGISELQQTIELLKTLKHHEIVSDIGSEAIGLILSYAKTWHLLLAYDEDNLPFPLDSKEIFQILNYSSAFFSFVGFNLSLNKVIRKTLNARQVSLAPLTEVLKQTRMEYGSITAFGLPEDWPVLIDSRLANSQRIVIGSGL